MLIDWVRIDETNWRAQLGDYRIDLCYNQFRTWMAVIEKPDGGRISTIGGSAELVRIWCERQLRHLLGLPVSRQPES